MKKNSITIPITETLAEQLTAFSQANKLAITNDSYIIGEKWRNPYHSQVLVISEAAEIKSGNYLIHILDPEESIYAKMKKAYEQDLKRQVHKNPFYWYDGKEVTSTTESGEPVTVTIGPGEYDYSREKKLMNNVILPEDFIYMNPIQIRDLFNKPKPVLFNGKIFGKPTLLSTMGDESEYYKKAIQEGINIWDNNNYTFYKSPNLYAERFWYPKLPSIHEFYAAQLAGLSVGEYKSEPQRFKRLLDKWHSTFSWNWPIGKPMYGFDPSRSGFDKGMISAHVGHGKTSALYYLFDTILLPGTKRSVRFDTEQDAKEIYDKLVAMTNQTPYYLKPTGDPEYPLTSSTDGKFQYTLSKEKKIKKPENKPFYIKAAEKGGKKRKKKY